MGQLHTLTVTQPSTAFNQAYLIWPSLPISASDVHAYILTHAAKLKGIAQQCKERDLTCEVLQ
jgi:hypothetical protein